MNKSLIYCTILALLVFVSSCDNTKRKGKKDSQTQMATQSEWKVLPDKHYVYPGMFNIVETDELVSYFNQLLNMGYEICSRFEEEDVVKNAIEELEKYAKGKRKYYPEEDIKKAINVMYDAVAYYEAHGVEPINECIMFMFRFMEQTARLCPNIEFMADFCSADKKVGVINIKGWSHNPLYSLLIYKDGKGCSLKMIDEYVKIEKIFCLNPDGEEYYLFSNNNLLQSHTGIYTFCQFLFKKKKDDMVLLCQNKKMPDSDIADNDNSEIIFNPKKLCWEYCKKKGKYFHKIDGTPCLNLELDGSNSHFYTVE